MTRFTQKSAFLTPILVTGSALLLTACGPSDGTATKGQTALSVQGTPPSGTTTTTTRSTLQRTSLQSMTTDTAVDISIYNNAGEADGTLTLTKAWIVVKEVDLEKDDEVEDDNLESSTEVEVEFIGPFVIDLLNNTASPELPALEIDAAFYDEIEIDIEKLGLNDMDANGEPLLNTYPELEDYSLYLEGTYTDQTASTYVDIPFTLKYDQTDEFEMSGAALGNGVAVEGGQTVDLIVAFRMARWFRFDDPETNDDNFNFSDAIVSDGAGGYQVVLDGNTNSDIMDIIEDNVEDSADFGEDSDDDGELDSDEDEDDDDDLDDEKDDETDDDSSDN